MARSRPLFPASPAQAGADEGVPHDAQVTLDSIGDAVLSTDLAGNITYLNPVAERMTGWSESEAVGRPLQEVMQIIDGDSRKPVGNPLALAIQLDTNASVSENSLLISRDGRESAIEDTAAPIHDRNGKVTGAVIVFHDVGVARALSLRMSHLAQHDVLTGLPNRMLFADRLDRAIAAARRLAASVRRSDTVSRHGGDEFVVLLSEVACAEDAAFTADNLLAAIAAPHRIEGRNLRVRASVGISVYPSDGQDAATLLRTADLALLQVKAQRVAWPAMTMIAATVSRAATNASRVEQTPDDKSSPGNPTAGARRTP